MNNREFDHWDHKQNPYDDQADSFEDPEPDYASDRTSNVSDDTGGYVYANRGRLESQQPPPLTSWNVDSERKRDFQDKYPRRNDNEYAYYDDDVVDSITVSLERRNRTDSSVSDGHLHPPVNVEIIRRRLTQLSAASSVSMKREPRQLGMIEAAVHSPSSTWQEEIDSIRGYDHKRECWARKCTSNTYHAHRRRRSDAEETEEQRWP